MSLAPKIKFNNGQEFPIFGLGTWKVSVDFTRDHFTALETGRRTTKSMNNSSDI
nr:unnamed protein product [Callosobruchus analis]